MLQPEKLFANIFDDKNITSLRLSNFGSDAITKFITANTDGRYTATIDALTNAQKPFVSGLSNIDTSKNTKKGKTQTLNEVKDGFTDFMSNKEGVIADAIGGFTSAAYFAFYPKGVTEYSTSTKTQMAILVKRINTAAIEFSAQLGEKLTNQLQAFEVQWEAALGEQTSIDGSLNDGRAERSTLRSTLENTLLSTIHLVAQQYPGDVAKCMSFFNFNLLTGVSRSAQPNIPIVSAQLS